MISQFINKFIVSASISVFALLKFLPSKILHLAESGEKLQVILNSCENDWNCKPVSLQTSLSSSEI